MRALLVMAIVLCATVSFADEAKKKDRNWEEVVGQVGVGLAEVVKGQQTEKINRILCFKRLQEAQAKVEKEGVKPVGFTASARKPSDFLVSAIGEVAWVDNSGRMIVSSEKGSVVVAGRGCDSSEFKGFDSKTAFQAAYDYMGHFSSKHWSDTKKFCQDAGFKTTFEQQQEAAQAKPKSSQSRGVN